MTSVLRRFAAQQPKLAGRVLASRERARAKRLAGDAEPIRRTVMAAVK